MGNDDKCVQSLLVGKSLLPWKVDKHQPGTHSCALTWHEQPHQVQHERPGDDVVEEELQTVHTKTSQ